jgi:hypothetical protein
MGCKSVNRSQSEIVQLLSCCCSPQEGGQRNQYSDQTTAWVAEESWFCSRQWGDILVFSKASRTALRTTQSVIQLASGTLSSGAERPDRRPDQSTPCSPSVQSRWDNTYVPQPSRGNDFAWPLTYSVWQTQPWRQVAAFHRRVVGTPASFSKDSGFLYRSRNQTILH